MIASGRSLPWLIVEAALTGAVAIGCGSPRDVDRDAREELAISTGVLEGVVTWTGTAIPTPTLVENTTDPQVCGQTQTLSDIVVSRRSRGLENVVLVLADVPAEKIPSLAPSRLVLDSRQCGFSPHVSVLTTGSTIEATNSDPILHTVHLYGPLEVNIALPLKDQRVRLTIERPGLVIVKCGVHPWMQAFVRVDKHPFHAVSASSGSFRMSGVPPGDYTLEAWHEKLGTARIRVQVRGGESLRVALAYPLPQ